MFFRNNESIETDEHLAKKKGQKQDVDGYQYILQTERNINIKHNGKLNHGISIRKVNFANVKIQPHDQQ